MTDNERQLEILRLLNEEINLTQKRLANEQRHPGGDVDASDQNMMDLSNYVVKLRAFREGLENAFSGVV